MFDGNPSLMKIKAEISMQIKMKLNLEQTFPESITIGLFLVNIKPLKHILVKKRNELANLIMETHATITAEKIEKCCAKYKTIYLRLIEVPTSIEQVFETREWIDTLPIAINNQSDIIRRLFKVHIILYLYYKKLSYVQSTIFCQFIIFRTWKC